MKLGFGIEHWYFIKNKENLSVLYIRIVKYVNLIHFS